jgi:uridine kinase
MKIISISGGSASGKTTLAKILNKEISNSFLLSQDHYTKDVSHLNDDELSKYNFDVPSAIHGDILIENIKELIKSGRTKIPEYDFETSSCKLFHKEIIKPQILIIEGIFSLHFEEIRKLSNLKLFVFAEESIRLERRIKRDILERGDTKEEILDRFYRFVKPGHDEFIEPQKFFCDLIIDSKDLEKEMKNLKNKINNLKNDENTPQIQF